MFFHHVITQTVLLERLQTWHTLYIAFTECSGLERAKNSLLVRQNFKPMRTTHSMLLTAKQDTHVAFLH